MRSPLLLLAFLFASSAAYSSPADKPLPPRSAAEELPLRLGEMTAEGFNDPAHLYFFRYQAFLLKNKLDGLDAETWKGLGERERAAKIKAGEGFLKDKLSKLLLGHYLDFADENLLLSVWGRDVAASVQVVDKALAVGDPEQIRKAREKVQALVKSVGGASMDWKTIFDGAAPAAVPAPDLPDPLALKPQSGFLASLQSKDVQAPLASKAAFVVFLQEKKVPEDALPALTAMYDVLSRAKEPEKSETAHLLPTVVRFLKDGKKIADEEYPIPGVAALGFAVSGDYDKPQRVGITSLSRTTDPVEVGDVLAHEFQHVYDMYAGRYSTLDTELRGFKANALFLNIMQKDPQMSKKLAELMNSDDNATRAFFRDEAQTAATHAESPKAFAEEVAFGHSYNSYAQGNFSGRLTLREAADPEMGLQRQISAQTGLLARAHATAETLRTRLAEISARGSSLGKEHDLEKTASDLASAQMTEIMLQREVAIDSLRLDRMRRELDWMDKRAAAAGQPAPAYDLSLAVGKDYVVP